MIRINLLSEGRRPVIARKTRPKLTLGDQEPSLLILAAGIVAGLLIAGVQWLALSTEIKGLDGELRVAQHEVDELQQILEEVAEFKAKQAELEHKIEVINDLTLQQEGPVHILDRVSRALPDLLWMTQMNFRGRKVDINGAAFNTNAIATFIENLDKVPEFQEPDPGAVKRDKSGTYTFRISFTFVQEQSLEDGASGPSVSM